MIWEILQKLDQTLITTWIVMSFALMLMKDFAQMKGRTFEPPRTMRTLWAELRPLFLPACFLHTFLGRGELFIPGHWWDLLMESLNYALWFLYKDVIDDDRWRRRREKLSESVQRRGAKLVVVPVKSS